MVFGKEMGRLVRDRLDEERAGTLVEIGEVEPQASTAHWLALTVCPIWIDKILAGHAYARTEFHPARVLAHRPLGPRQILVNETSDFVLKGVSGWIGEELAPPCCFWRRLHI